MQSPAGFPWLGPWVSRRRLLLYERAALSVNTVSVRPQGDHQSCRYGVVVGATVLTGGSLLASTQLAGALFVGLALFFGFRWRTSALAVIVVIVVNVLYPGGADRVLSAALFPLKAISSNAEGCRQADKKAAIEEERRRPYPPNH
jgi:hypothetical protein